MEPPPAVSLEEHTSFPSCSFSSSPEIHSSSSFSCAEETVPRSSSSAQKDKPSLSSSSPTPTDITSCPAEAPKKPAKKKPAKRRTKRRLTGKAKPSQKRRGGGGGGEEGRSGEITVKTCQRGEKRRWDKRHYCLFCKKPQGKIGRHLLHKHSEEPEVNQALSLPKGSKDRHLLLEQLRCKGDYRHNIEVIRQGRGEIVTWRQPSEVANARDYLPCTLCLGFFLKDDLWKHEAACRKKSGQQLPDHTAPDATAATPPTTAEKSRKRRRVQAASSRLLPISGGASERCSEIIHRMHQDKVSFEVKSDALICKYGNRLLGSQDGDQMKYDYVSQKMRELARFLLAAKSLDSKLRSLQDLLVPPRLKLAVAAAKKASGYRGNRPPLAVKTALKTVCEIVIGDSLQDGDWEAAARATDFFDLLGSDWELHAGLNPPTPAPAVGASKWKRKVTQQGGDIYKNRGVEQLDLGLEVAVSGQGAGKPEVPPRLSHVPADFRTSSLPPPELRKEGPLNAPVSRKAPRRPWSPAEKEAVWRQLGFYIFVQTVPGKELCMKCLELEPALRNRHWKDIKNQVHNQIETQKKHIFYNQVDRTMAQDPQGDRAMAQDPQGNRTMAQDPQGDRTMAQDPQGDRDISHDSQLDRPMAQDSRIDRGMGDVPHVDGGMGEGLQIDRGMGEESQIHGEMREGTGPLSENSPVNRVLSQNPRLDRDLGESCRIDRSLARGNLGDGHQVGRHLVEGPQTMTTDSPQANRHFNKETQLEAHLAERLQTNRHLAENSQIDNRMTRDMDRHLAEGHQSNRHLADGHQSNRHLDDGHQSNRHLADGHQSNRHLADGHQSNRHLDDGHQSNRHLDDGHQSNRHLADGHQSNRHLSRDPQIDRLLSHVPQPSHYTHPHY